MKSRRATIIANIILTSALVFFTLSLIYTVYRSNFYPPGTMNKYYIVLVAGILLCALTLKLRESYRENVALSLLSIIAGGYIIEFFLFCCAAQSDSISLRAETVMSTKLPFDARTRYQVFTDLREAGRDVYLSINATQLANMEAIESDGEAILPLGGISGKLTLHCNESGEYTFYQADEHGFNNPMGLYARSNIVLVGDSFTHGNCVLAGEDIAGQLRKRQKDAINLGYSGNGPLMELATLREYAAPIKPGIVLWLYYEGNDLQDLLVEGQNPLLMEYLDTDFSQYLLDRQPDIDSALINYVERKAAEIEETKDGGWLDTQFTRIVRLHHLRERLQILIRSSRPSPPPPPLFEEILKAARDLTIAGGGQLYIVYLPSWSRYVTEVNEGDLFHRDQVLSIAGSLDIPVIDMHETFLQHPDPLSFFPFRMEGHYTVKGYELVALTIDSYLGEPEVSQ